MTSPPSPSFIHRMRHLIATAAGALLGLALAVALLVPPSPAPADAEGFSAHRAGDTLAAYATEPHSSLDEPGRTRALNALLTEIRALGLEPQVHRHMISSHGPAPYGEPPANLIGLPLDNIVVRIPGSSGRAVMLMSHWDSAPGHDPSHSMPGPGESHGVGDAGYGVATIVETLRLVTERDKPPINDLLVLITDGEELGLLGASYELVHNPELFADVRVVMNLEASGTCGRALLFETGSGDAAVTRVWLEHAGNPWVSSATTAIYRALPFGTDLTPFLGKGFTGLNVAAVDCFENYHTEHDSLANLDHRTLQSYGDQVWPVVDALLATPDLDLSSDHDLVYGTLAPGITVRYATGVGIGLAVLLAAGTIVLTVRYRPRAGAVARGIGALVWPIGALAALLLGLGMVILGRTNDLVAIAQFPGQDAALVVALLALAGLQGWWARRHARRHGAAATFNAVLIVLTVLAVTIAVAAPGFGYLVALPGLALLVARLLGRVPVAGLLLAGLTGLLAVVTAAPLAFVATQIVTVAGLVLPLALSATASTTAVAATTPDYPDRPSTSARS